jgi:flagellin
MGLRINSNIASIMALRNLRIADRNQLRSMERLSTGLKINSAADDPSGLVVSDQLRAQVASLHQAVTNATFANNLIGTSESALAQVTTLLTGIRESAIFALNTGGTSVEQIAAEQDSVDNSIAAIDRIASTTRFATSNLLNGESGFYIANQSNEIIDLKPISLTFDMRTQQTTYTLNVITPASQGILTVAGAAASNTVIVSGGAMELRITGNLGTETITLASGATLKNLWQAVNILRGNTGVYASNQYIYSDRYGSEEYARVEKVSGGNLIALGAMAVGDKRDDFGADANANLNGSSVSAKGNDLSLVSPFFSGTLGIRPGTVAGAYTFTVRNSGLLFQMNTEPVPADQVIIGLPNVGAEYLGKQITTTGGVQRGGFLNTIMAGGDNDLFNNPGNAVEVVDAAINDINDVRAYIGAFTAFTVQPAIDQLEVAIENLQASESSIRDLDFAEEMAEFTKTQIIYQAGISVIAQANTIPQSVLQLLQR